MKKTLNYLLNFADGIFGIRYLLHRRFLAKQERELKLVVKEADLFFSRYGGKKVVVIQDKYPPVAQYNDGVRLFLKLSPQYSIINRMGFYQLKIRKRYSPNVSWDQICKSAVYVKEHGNG